MKGLEDVTREIVDLFDQLSIPYAIMGGVAVRMHALPRPTFDVDFTVAISRDLLPGLYKAAEQLGYAIPTAYASGWVDAVKGLPVIKLQHLIGDRSIDVDIFLAETDFQRELLSRRQRHEAEGWQGWFVTAEDLILLKLLADRPKDRTDVADILFIQGNLDEAYLRVWAERLGVVAALDEAIRQNRRS